MKRIKWMLAALLAVAIAAPAFAQSRDPHANEKWADNKAAVSAAIERAAVKAQQARRTNPYFKGGDPHNAANYEKCRWCGEPLTDENLSRRCPADPDVHCLPAPKSDAKAHTCYRCGKSFRAGQHCSAADYTALCANSPEQERQLNEAAAERAAAAEKASTCPKCGEAYDIDVLYHGMEHHCAAEEDNQANTPVCVRCGEEITSAGQHCPAAGYTSLCSASAEQNRQTAPCDTQTVCPKCHKAYTIDEKYHGVQHECSGGNGGEPETGWYFVEIATPASTSPNGGEPETEFFCVHASEASAAEGGEPQAPFFCEVDVDALYRAEELLQADRDAHDGYAVHTLEYYYEQTAGKAPAKNDQKTAKLKKAKTEYCIYCGEAILKDGQVCTAQGYGCRCTTSCPDCGQNLRDPRHTINGEHRCKFKTRIKVAPIKKPAK